MASLLCVPIMVLDEHTALADAAAARDADADLVEFRIDEFFTGARGSGNALDPREVRTILRIIAESPLPCIVTCRAAAESGGVGGYDGDEMARVSLFERLGTATPRSMTEAAGAGRGVAEHPPRYIDFEFASYAASANVRQKLNLAVDHPGQRRDVRTGLILSTHDFTGRPRDLLRRLAIMRNEPAASIVKVAYAARSIRDNLELFDLLIEGASGDDKPMIALAMGRFGLMSRVLAPKFGGFLTFASLRPSAATAPGQPTVAELLDVYRFRSITPRTRVFGLIGWPVEHSLGPLIHNAGFDALEPDTWNDNDNSNGNGEQEPRGGRAFHGVYLPLPVPPEWEHFKATLAALIDHPRLDFCGCSITVPHKQHLVRFASEARSLGADGIEWTIDDLSEACGAANTLAIERDAGGRPLRARVVNTDSAAAVACIGDAVGDLRGVRVGLIGAGGVSRAIAAGLLRARATVFVLNRTIENAERLCDELRSAVRTDHESPEISPANPARLADLGCRVLINCTPVGMANPAESDEEPVTPVMSVPLDVLKACAEQSEETVVMDTVYIPLETELLKAARRLRMRTIDGLGMFVRQAGDQFTAWTGAPAPVGLFERVAREALQERQAP
ncbi:MAG: type I 3-dehydroquinate dehydratase [Phycisphaerales bacterium]|nr:type I 3-dehydroquinate dehydratase [Phycisphaerales bacterium]